MQRLLPVSLAVAMLLGLSAIPAGAGGDAFQRLDVSKVIEGPVPPGAEFVVNVTCVDGSDMTVVDEDLTFTSADTQQVDLGGSSISCTVEETVTAGATVTYACESIEQSDCTSDNAFTNTSDVASTVVTVTNTFTPPEPAPEIVVGPTFTG